MNNNNNNYNNGVSDIPEAIGYSISSYKNLMLIVILGYFAVKVLDRIITKRESCDENDIFYKNSQYDFMGLLVFGSFIYLFNTYLVDIKLTKSLGFMLFYIIGLGYGVFYNNAKKKLKDTSDSTSLNFMMGIFYLVVLLVIVFSLYTGMSSPNKVVMYVMFMVAFVGVAYYLNTFNQKYRNLEKPENIYIFTDKLVLTIPMVAFLINFLFIRVDESTEFVSILLKTMSGLFLGIFVGCLAVFGVHGLIPGQTVINCKDNEKGVCNITKVSGTTFIDAYKSSNLANTTLIMLLITLIGLCIFMSFTFVDNFI